MPLTILISCGSSESDDSKAEETIKEYELSRHGKNGNENYFEFVSCEFLKEYTIQDSINFVAAIPYTPYGSSISDKWYDDKWYNQVKKMYLRRIETIKEYPERINTFKERDKRGEVNMARSWINNELKSLEDDYQNYLDWYNMFHQSLEGKKVDYRKYYSSPDDRLIHNHLIHVVSLEEKGKETVVGKMYKCTFKTIRNRKKETITEYFLLDPTLENVILNDWQYFEAPYFELNVKDFPKIQITNDLNEQSVEENIDSTGYGFVERDGNILLGIWTGSLDDKPLKIVIERVEGNELFGYNQVGTNKRPVSGTFVEGGYDQPCCIAFDAVLHEPGDDKWDGVFNVKFVCYQKQSENASGDLVCNGDYNFGGEAIGEWKSNNGKLNRKVILNRQSK